MKKRPTVYICGPMRGIRQFNHPAFDKAEEKLKAMGFRVINPAAMDRARGLDPKNLPFDWDWFKIPPTWGSVRDVFLRDTEAICKRVDIIYRLPGTDWDKSKGVNAEVALGRALGLLFLKDL